MKKENNFTISQLAKACKTSRATLLRLESAGLLTPAFVDEASGYRYYDSKSVFRVTRILSYQDLGISQKELSYFATQDNAYDLILQSLEKKLRIMEAYVENLKVYTGQYKHLSVIDYSFPEHYCYTKIIKDETDSTKIRGYLWKAFDEAVQKGYSVNRSIGPYVSIDLKKAITEKFTPKSYDYTLCIPIVAPLKGDNIVHVCRANTVSAYMNGGSSDIGKAIKIIIDRIGQTDKHLCGEARVVGIIFSYPGEEIPIEEWISRLCIPVS